MDTNNKHLFEETFFKNKRGELINIIDELIDNLPSNQDKWTINALINYLNILYLSYRIIVVAGGGNKGNKYESFNINLFDKNNSELYFVMQQKEDESFICIEDNKYFFTDKELEAKDLNIIINRTIGENNYDEYFKLLKLLKDKKLNINIEDNPTKNKNKTTYKGGWQHIIYDGCDNFPIDFINCILGTKYIYWGKTVICDFKEKLEGNKTLFDSVKEIIKRAINRSLKKAARNLTLIAPILHFKDEDFELSFILPLYLLRNEKPDCVLVFSYDKKEGKFLGSTLLNLKEALQDVRIFGSTDQFSWLKE